MGSFKSSITFLIISLRSLISLTVKILFKNEKEEWRENSITLFPIIVASRLTVPAMVATALDFFTKSIPLSDG